MLGVFGDLKPDFPFSYNIKLWRLSEIIARFSCQNHVPFYKRRPSKVFHQKQSQRRRAVVAEVHHSAFRCVTNLLFNLGSRYSVTGNNFNQIKTNIFETIHIGACIVVVTFSFLSRFSIGPDRKRLDARLRWQSAVVLWSCCSKLIIVYRVQNDLSGGKLWISVWVDYWLMSVLINFFKTP